MKSLIINVDGEDKVFNLPTSWDGVTVEQAIQIDKIKMDDFEYNEDTPMSKVVAGKHQAITEYFANIILVFHPDFDKEYMGMVPYEHLTDVIKLFDFIKEPLQGTSTPEFITIEGEDYYLRTEFNQLLVNEIISLNTIQDKYGDNFIDSIPEMLCIFLRKKLPNGELEMFRNSFMDRANMFSNVMVGDIANLFVFFLDGNQTSQESMKEYLVSQKQEKKIDTEN